MEMLNSQLQVICMIIADYSMITVCMNISYIITLLFLSELQVLVDPAIVTDGDRVTLTCTTTCSLSNNPTYIWYRNSQPLTNPHPTSSNTLSITSVSDEDAGYYSCAVRGHEGHPSPSVCK